MKNQSAHPFSSKAYQPLETEAGSVALQGPCLYLGLFSKQLTGNGPSSTPCSLDLSVPSLRDTAG